MSLSRVLTIVRKDLSWAVGNLKLLGIMILPVFVIVFFSRFDSAATFGFSLIFVNAFVGIFSTSYLIIEEKNKGTLLALLTSPLTGAELLLGKFLFNLILCSFFSLLVILFNQRLDLLVQPLAILNILLFAGTTCFVGFVTGVFFKNEQEMSVLAPFLMVLFCFGDAAEKVSDTNKVHAFFPDYHLAESVKDIPLSSGELLSHSFFSFLMFFVAFFMATFYTRFYFSNNREKRWSNRLGGFVLLFVVTLAASGFYARQGQQGKILEEGLEQYSVATPSIKVSFKLDPEVFTHKTLLESRKKSMELLSFKKDKNANIVFAIRDLESDEMDLLSRANKIKSDGRRQLISESKRDWDLGELRQWVYLKRNSLVVLRESLCGTQIFQYSMDIKLVKIKRLESRFKSFEKVFNSIQFTCSDRN